MQKSRFLGTVVRVAPKNRGAFIRPAWGTEDGSEDLFAHFVGSCLMKEGMTVSFVIGHDEESGRIAATEVSYKVLDGALTERPLFLPSAIYLDLMKSAWNSTHSKERVEELEREYLGSLSDPKEVSQNLNDLFHIQQKRL